MAQLNPSIILGARQPDIVGQMGRAAQTAGVVNAVGRENRLMDLFREQGPQIMAGDQNALNALAQLSPDRALGVQESRLGMDATRQNMSQSAEMHAAQLGEIRRRAAEAAVQAAQQQDAERLAAETAEAKRLVSMALMDPQNADKYLSQSEHTREFVGQNLDAVAVAIMGAEDGLKYAMEQRNPPEAPAAMQTLQMRAQAAGLQPGTPEYAQFMLQGGRSSDSNGVSMTMPDGTRVQVGGSQPQGGGVDPSGPGYMLDTINSILSDEALDNSTGLLSWTQAVPGTPMYRFGTRVKQLEGQAFLQAFESLKGGGQITEIEGQKATQAIGRIDSGMRPEDFRDAMKELQTILGRALERPRGWADTSAGKISTMSAEEIGALDLGNLSAEERAAARQRLKDLIDG